MSVFAVKVRTAAGQYSFDQMGVSSAEVLMEASALFGHLCAVTVMPK